MAQPTLKEILDAKIRDARLDHKNAMTVLDAAKERVLDLEHKVVQIQRRIKSFQDSLDCELARKGEL
jgi:phage shock protein A